MTKHMAVRIAIALFLMVTFSQVSLAQHRGHGNGFGNGYGNRNDNGYGRWEYLGESNVDGRFDHDRIEVGRDEGRFRALQIKVSNAPIYFQRVVVHYENGTSEVLHFRNRIPAGGQTRVFDLRGHQRAIDNVEFFYSRGSWGWSAKPKVRLFGR
jgi:hypothetical protein